MSTTRFYIFNYEDTTEFQKQRDYEQYKNILNKTSKTGNKTIIFAGHGHIYYSGLYGLYMGSCFKDSSTINTLSVDLTNYQSKVLTVQNAELYNQFCNDTTNNDKAVVPILNNKSLLPPFLINKVDMVGLLKLTDEKNINDINWFPNFKNVREIDFFSKYKLTESKLFVYKMEEWEQYKSLSIPYLILNKEFDTKNVHIPVGKYIILDELNKEIKKIAIN